MELVLTLAAAFLAAAILLNVLQILKTLLEIAKICITTVLNVVGGVCSVVFYPCMGRR
jgi:hypothetical protein